MAILHPSAPSPGPTILAAHLAEVLGNDRILKRMLGEHPKEDLAVSPPHPVYVLEHGRIRQGGHLDRARLTAWRYLLFVEEEAVAAAELALTDDGPEFGGLNTGPFVQATIDALLFAETLDEVGEADFELRLLRSPSLLFTALWLHGPRDLLIPLRRRPRILPNLVPGRAYSPGQVLDQLRQALIARGR